ncbi:MAG: hypothetical protein ABL889_05675 [Terricaulis sp.]
MLWRLRTFGPLVVSIAHAVAMFIYYGQYGTSPSVGSILLSVLLNGLALVWVVLRIRDATKRGARD